jgi:hypothetical protein
MSVPDVSELLFVQCAPQTISTPIAKFGGQEISNVQADAYDIVMYFDCQEIVVNELQL